MPEGIKKKVVPPKKSPPCKKCGGAKKLIKVSGSQKGGNSCGCAGLSQVMPK